MSAYSVTTADITHPASGSTGEPAGTYSGQSYWSWIASGATYYLWYSIASNKYMIGLVLGGLAAILWIATSTGTDPTGTYVPRVVAGGATENATVALAAATYIVFEITDGVDAGKQFAVEMS